MLLCPNCHSYTPNFRTRNLKYTQVSDEDFVYALRDSKNIREALIKLGLSAKGANYKRAYHLIDVYDLIHLK